MCLSIPGKVISVKENEIIVDYETEQRTSNLSLVDIQEGDYVIISNKIIINKIDKEKAEKMLGMLNDW